MASCAVSCWKLISTPISVLDGHLIYRGRTVCPCLFVTAPEGPLSENVDDHSLHSRHQGGSEGTSEESFLCENDSQIAPPRTSC
jgi:hypothetical protein